jgi:glucan phosphoethanolaminetransferase (alkaline phosphatase superfamily)
MPNHALHRSADAAGSLSLGVRPTPHMTKLILKLAVVFGIQAVMAWFFYRCRVISHESWAGSDFVVFLLPLLVGFAVAAGVLFFSFHRKRIAAALGLSAVGAVVASFVSTVIAFNLYGT